jgi:hypothetical protein
MKFLITALLVGSSVTAFAQSNSLSAVQGNVTVTSGSTTSKAAVDSVLKNGDLITASSGASTTVKIGSCSVSLTPGQSLVVNTALPCDKLAASVQSITVPGSTLAGIPGGAVGVGAAIVGGGLIIREVTKKDKASGS